MKQSDRTGIPANAAAEVYLPRSFAQIDGGPG